MTYYRTQIAGNGEVEGPIGLDYAPGWVKDALLDYGWETIKVSHSRGNSLEWTVVAPVTLESLQAQVDALVAERDALIDDAKAANGKVNEARRALLDRAQETKTPMTHAQAWGCTSATCRDLLVSG